MGETEHGAAMRLSRRQLLLGVTVAASAGLSKAKVIARSDIFDVMDFGAVKTSFSLTQAERQRVAEINRRAIEEAVGRALASGGAAKVVFPKGDFLLGANSDSSGIYVGRRLYSRVGIRLRNGRGVSLLGENTRLLRTDVTKTAQDKYSSHVMIDNFRDFRVSGIDFIGQQDFDDINSGTGHAISIINGSSDGVIEHAGFFNCGAGAGVSIGENRIAGPNRYDVSRPAFNIDVLDCKVTNSRYFCVVNIAHDINIARWRHKVEPFEVNGEQRPGYSRRSLYLLGCTDVTAVDGEIDGVGKTSILLAVYPRNRSYSDMRNIKLDKISVVGSGESVEDYNVGLELQDANEIVCEKENSCQHVTAQPTTMSQISVSNVRMQNVKVGIWAQSATDFIASRYLLSSASFSGLDITAFGPAVTFTSAHSFEKVRIADSRLLSLSTENYSRKPCVHFRCKMEQVGKGVAPSSVELISSNFSSFGVQLKVDGVDSLDVASCIFTTIAGSRPLVQLADVSHAMFYRCNLLEKDIRSSGNSANVAIRP